MILKSKNPTLQWIRSISKPVIPSVVLISIIGMLDALCGVVLALQSKNVIDFAVAKNYDDLKVSVFALVLLIILQFLLSFLYMKCSANVVAKHSLKLQKSVFSRAVNMCYSKASLMHTGEILNRITTDAEVVMCTVIGIVPQLVAFSTGVVASFVALLVIQPGFAVLCALVGVFAGFGAMIWGRRLKKLSLVCRKWNDKCNSFMMECIQNLLVIKSFSNEEKVAEHTGKIQANTYKALKKRNNNNILASLASEFVFTFGYFLAIGWGAFGMAFDFISYGNLMAMVQLVGKIQSPFKSIASVIPQYYQMLASAERIMDIICATEEKEDGNIKDFKCIEFRDVTFSYDGENEILKNTDLVVNKGDFILISGISGVGKSTILKLMLNMYKVNGGEITVTDTDGMENKLDANYRGLFSYVPQGNMVLSGTVLENVVFFSENADEKKVEECLKLACLWEDIAKMPQGVDTVVGENGIGLSEGQVQRLAVARALYRQAPVLLLDEATSALDIKTEAKMLANIKKMKARTCILISHKKGAKEYMDKEIIIEDKKIIEVL